jgi:hypothetical protein
MSDNPKVTDKYPSLVIPGYIYSAKGEPLTTGSQLVAVDPDSLNAHWMWWI